MRLEIVRGFLSTEECVELNAWVHLAISMKWMDAAVFKAEHGKRLTTRIYPHRFDYPAFVYELSGRVRAAVGITHSPKLYGNGHDGIVVTQTTAGGSLAKHRDFGNDPSLAVLRCNLMTQKPESGGVLHIEDNPVDLEIGDLHCFLASEHTHHVSEVEGDTPRILWMFGGEVSADLWNTNKINICKP